MVPGTDIKKKFLEKQFFLEFHISFLIQHLSSQFYFRAEREKKEKASVWVQEEKGCKSTFRWGIAQNIWVTLETHALNLLGMTQWRPKHLS